MTSPAKSAAGLRPFLPSDAPLLAEIFRASIAELTTDDYSEAQQAAWMASAGDIFRQIVLIDARLGIGIAADPVVHQQRQRLALVELGTGRHRLEGQSSR